jgi:hypothetical protein
VLVIDAVCYPVHHNANTIGLRPARKPHAIIRPHVPRDFLNADPDEVAFGANMTLTARGPALGRRWGPGDEIVTELDHHAT